MKNYFCENCGHRLSDGDIFCENCGAKLDDDRSFCENPDRGYREITDIESESGSIDPISAFSNRRWDIEWKKFVSLHGNQNCGIILCNTALFNNKERFYSKAKRYIEFRQTQGIWYCLIDLATQSVCKLISFDIKSVVGLLQEVYYKAKPKYLFIVGNDRVIGSVKWKNPCSCITEKIIDKLLQRDSDDDEFIDSDLPYVISDLYPPQNGGWKSYKYNEAIRVGRLPCRSENGFKEFFDYADNVMNKRISDVRSFALSAKTFISSSKVIARKFSDTVYSCPKIGVEALEGDGLKTLVGDEPNLLYFNLHGGSEKALNDASLPDLWLGEEGGRMDAIQYFAFKSECLPKKNGYIIGTEACYGAKPNMEKSILCTALRNGCSAFLGSRQLAYGNNCGIPSCADILVGEFSLNVYNNASVGDAYIRGLDKLTSNKQRLDANELKTLGEFALYGDPSERLKSDPVNVRPKFFFKPTDFQKFNTEIHIPMPDVRAAVRLMLTEINEKIMYKINETIASQYVGYAHSTPVVCKVEGYGGYQAVWSRKLNGMTGLLCAYFDEHGNIEKIYTSK